MSAEQRNEPPVESLPKARTEKNYRKYLFWLIPIAALAIAAWIFYTEIIAKGPTIEVYFDNAEGLQKGQSKVKFRGVEIGTIEDVALTDDRQFVKVTASLVSSAASVARKGSLFWIVKPELGLNKITGLQTVMGGSYLAVEPGTGKEEQTKFRALPEAPATKKEEPGRRVILLAENLGSIKDYSPVLYHGVKVGEVEGSSLDPTAQAIRIYLNIDRKYAPLVRMNSKFWNAGGVNVSLGWSGLDISAQSIRTLIGGGIDFATPDTKAEAAYEGAAFRLYPKAEKSWQAWFPAIELPLVKNPAVPAPENQKSGHHKRK